MLDRHEVTGSNPVSTTLTNFIALKNRQLEKAKNSSCRLSCRFAKVLKKDQTCQFDLFYLRAVTSQLSNFLSFPVDLLQIC